MTKNKALIEKIKALLAKAASTEFEHEAALFADKARQLMEQYQIDVTDLEHDDPVDISKPYSATTSAPSYKKHLWTSLAKYYGCRTVLNWTSHDTYTVDVIGRESARVTLELMYPFVMEQVRKAGKQIYEEKKHLGDLTVERCIRKVANALILRIQAEIVDREPPKPTTQGGKNALVTLDAVNALIERTYKDLSKGSKRSIGTDGAARAAASGISLARQTTGGSTKLIGRK